MIYHRAESKDVPCLYILRLRSHKTRPPLRMSGSFSRTEEYLDTLSNALSLPAVVPTSSGSGCPPPFFCGLVNFAAQKKSASS
jgi:hypothetical protein